MLPQKFSAATTVTIRLPPTGWPFAVLHAAAPQASATAQHARATVAACRQLPVMDTGSLRARAPVAWPETGYRGTYMKTVFITT